jgi:hypothetical protein
MAPLLPKCLALLACRAIEVDPASGRPSLVDVFQEFTSAGLPAVLTQVVVWVDLADGLGDFAVELSEQQPSAVTATMLRLASVQVRAVFTRPGRPAR